MNKNIETNYQQPTTKHPSGITLVALVVTIIVLLILGGTAISLISGEEGLFAKANHATSLYNNAALAQADRLNKIIEGNYISTKPLDPIPELTTTDLNITISPDTNINPEINGSGVMVTLEEKEETGYQLQYSINGGKNYKNYTAPFEVTEYGTVILARLYDTATEREGDSTATYTVTNIDILPPNEFNLSASATGTSITVSASGTVTDANATDTSAKSTIVKYEYKLDSGSWVTPTTATSTSYTFTGLTAGTSHTVSMRATDTAGNVREAINKGYSISTKLEFEYDFTQGDNGFSDLYGVSQYDSTNGLTGKTTANFTRANIGATSGNAPRGIVITKSIGNTVLSDEFEISFDIDFLNGTYTQRNEFQIILWKNQQAVCRVFLSNSSDGNSYVYLGKDNFSNRIGDLSCYGRFGIICDGTTLSLCEKGTVNGSRMTAVDTVVASTSFTDNIEFDTIMIFDGGVQGVSFAYDKIRSVYIGAPKYFDDKL